MRRGRRGPEPLFLDPHPLPRPVLPSPVLQYSLQSSRGEMCIPTPEILMLDRAGEKTQVASRQTPFPSTPGPSGTRQWGAFVRAPVGSWPRPRVKSQESRLQSLFITVLKAHRPTALPFLPFLPFPHQTGFMGLPCRAPSSYRALAKTKTLIACHWTPRAPWSLEQKWGLDAITLPMDGAL